MSQQSHQSGTVYEGRIVTLRLEETTARDGKKYSREIVEHADAAAVVAVDVDDRVLLIRQRRPAVAKTLLELPAGLLDAGEAPSAAAARELEEETGVRADRVEPLVAYYTSPGFCTEYLHVFEAVGLSEGAQRLDPGEDLDVLRMPLEEALRRVAEGEIVDSKTVVGLLAYARKHGR